MTEKKSYDFLPLYTTAFGLDFYYENILFEPDFARIKILHVLAISATKGGLGGICR